MQGKLSSMTKVGLVVSTLVLLGAIALQVKGPKLLKADLWTEEELRAKVTRMDTSKAEDVYLTMEALLEHHKVHEGFKRLILQLYMAWMVILFMSLVLECLHRTSVKPG